VIDPLVMTVGADSDAGRITLDTIRLLTERYGININLGASNVSFGLPDRHTLNQAFLGLAIAAGASCALTDAAKLGATIRAADLLRGRDQYGMRYIKYFRDHQPKDE
jgi:5-methyltetrahydrofolate--homocysteine methyltransferase